MANVDESPLDVERKSASFNVKSMTYLLDGGERITHRKEQIRDLVAKDPVFNRDDVYFLSREERLKKSFIKQRHALSQIRKHKLDIVDQGLFYEAIGEQLPYGVHRSMFIPTIKSQGSEEQVAYWLPLAEGYKVLGTYAQTELGHGTFIRGLETTATYIRETQEFEIHSPTLTSTKWWPGGLGKACNHCVLMAKLIVDGKDYGLHSFIVQLRRFEDHKPLSGITAGDIGPKYGWNSMENGFLRFDHVRIPRTNMLMRYASVAADGTYTKPPHARINYGTMILVRAGIVTLSAGFIARAITIAIRYSAVRRQGLGAEGNKAPELKVLDYTLQQYRLLPYLASAYALHFTSVYMSRTYEELNKQIQQGDFSRLPELHATTAGLKAYCTWLTSGGIEECRLSAGGHGYSLFSGLPTLFQDFVPACTYEGENGVLIQQTARYLIKCVRNVATGKGVTGNVKYLEEGLKSFRTEKCGATDFRNTDTLLAAYRHRACRLIAAAAVRLQNVMKGGMKFDQAWNVIQADLNAPARAHCYLIMLQSFADAVERVSDPSLRTVLKRLLDLFALYHMEQQMIDFVEDGYMNSEQAQKVRLQVRALLSEIRPDAVPLVDAFSYPDFLLNSAIGRYDGKAYETLYEWAQRNPINKRDPVVGYEEGIKPMVEGQFLAKL